MWVKDILLTCRLMQENLTAMRKAARQKDSDAVEEIAKDIEGQAASLVAAMQIDGIWVGIRRGV